MNIRQKYMFRAIEIARNGLGTTAPNPMVGAVIVHDNEIIGEGYTSAFGGPHAEVNAIASVATEGQPDEGQLNEGQRNESQPKKGQRNEGRPNGAQKNENRLKDATLYVTLEPCSHFGKTPPCTDLIIDKGIKTVVIGLQDPHDKVAGKGLEKLKKAGIEVITGVLEEECREHHKRFLTFHEKKRPYIILKWAQTADGFIAPPPREREQNPAPVWISHPYSRQLVHQWRSEEQAILVGTNTVLEDNPKLNVRHWTGRNPTRIVLDRSLKTHSSNKNPEDNFKTITKANPDTFETISETKPDTELDADHNEKPVTKSVTKPIGKIKANQEIKSGPKSDGEYHVLDRSVPTLILTEVRDASRYRKGIDYRILDFSENIAKNIVKILHEHDIQSVVVEGGAQTLQTFIDTGLWDEARIFEGPSSFKNGIKAPVLSGKLTVSKTIRSDQLKIFQNVPDM
ncbi:MAG: bifunctional diaminohydroxyphosphoribosylaminopyrimidine deaminase/5-amino-6-(5-phosphoribosylamino)uracil reductase RibD [Pricia sp.]